MPQPAPAFEMAPDRWARARSLFANALERDVTERESFLSDACADDGELRSYVGYLLQQYVAAGSLLSASGQGLVVPTTEVPRFVTGNRIGDRFVILRFLGQGGMGEVYAAEDQTVGETVAVKTLRSELARRPGAVNRFRSEVRRARKVTHPNVCRVHELFETADETGKPCVFLTMELLTGETLSAKLRRDGRYRREEAYSLLRQIAAGLDAAHATGIVHKDLKPGNVFLVDDGQRAVITDFGLAGLLAGHEEAGRSLSKEVGGTPGYMAPEQLSNGAVTRAADVYALGVVAREIVEQNAGWEEAIRSALQYEPERRPGTASEFVASLGRTRGWMTRRNWLWGGVVTAGASIFYSLRQVPTGNGAVRIAVLPFENLTGRAESAYVGDGLTEQLILGLQRIPEFWVAGRNSVYRFQAGSLPARELAKQLGVNWLVMGSVSALEGKLRVNARLVNSNGGAGPWTANVERENGAIGGVAVEMADGLRQTLAPSAGKTANRMRGGTGNEAALDTYMRGRHLWNRRNPGDLNAAIGLFEEAVKLDGDFALAHCGIADALAALADTGAVSPIAQMARAKGAALDALRAESRLGHAHASYALVTSLFDFDLATAEQSFQRALAMDPFDAPAHQWYSALLFKLGRFTDSLREADAAFARDSLSLSAQFARAGMHYFVRRYGDTVSMLHEVQKASPGFWQTHEYLAECHARLGNRQAAVDEARRAIEKSNYQTHTLAYAGVSYALLGMKREAEEMARRVEKENREGRYYQPTHIARIYAELHDAERASVWIDRMIEQRDTGISVLAVHHSFDWLRQEGKLEDAIRRARVIYPEGKIPRITSQTGQG